MSLIPALTSFSPSTTIQSAQVNANFASIRTTVNTYGAFVDQVATITGAWTFSTSPTITNALTVGTGLTVTSGGLTVTAGASTFGANVTVTGTVAATTFSGSGASLTNVPAAQLTGTLPAIDGNALTNLNAANLAGTLPAISGANLTSLNASNIASGTLADARLPSTMTAKTIATVTLSSGGSEVVLGTADDVMTFNATARGLLLTSGANSLVNLQNCPVATSANCEWLKVDLNGTQGYIPVVR